MTDPIQIAYLEWLIESRRAELLGVLDARNYYNGVQQDFVPSAMIDILSRHKSVGNPFTLNVCETIVTALANILNLTGFDTNETPDENGVKPLAVWANEVWKHNRMAAVQDIIHEGALSDREVLSSWIGTRNHPCRALCITKYISPTPEAARACSWSTKTMTVSKNRCTLSSVGLSRTGTPARW